jgi:translation initiation factor 2 beta subunit (eIF-2beta)/eIF-5
MYSLQRMSDPEYFICLVCETPTYDFDLTGDKLTLVRCPACGADDPSEFMTENELEEQQP